MKKKTRTRFGSILLCMAMLLSLLPVTALADGGSDDVTPVVYLDVDRQQGTCEEYTLVAADTTAWPAGWYVVTGTVILTGRVQVSGSVHLILTDGAVLTAEKGISVTAGNSLTIYGQTEGTGKLTARAYQVTALRLSAALMTGTATGTSAPMATSSSTAATSPPPAPAGLRASAAPSAPREQAVPSPSTAVP